MTFMNRGEAVSSCDHMTPARTKSRSAFYILQKHIRIPRSHQHPSHVHYKTKKWEAKNKGEEVEAYGASWIREKDPDKKTLLTFTLNNSQTCFLLIKLKSVLKGAVRPLCLQVSTLQTNSNHRRNSLRLRNAYNISSFSRHYFIINI